MKTAFDPCHCSRCRAASGSAFLAELEFTTAKFKWISGRLELLMAEPAAGEAD